LFTKKVFHLFITAAFLITLFTLTTFAYSYDIYGCVTGLEEGKEYTVAKYDITAEEWSSETELTAETVLPHGIWRITEENGGSEELFIGNENSGHINYWNADGSNPGNFLGSAVEGIVSGKWTVNTTGAYTRLVHSSMQSSTIPTVCIYFEKSLFLNTVDGSYAYGTPKTGSDNLLQESKISYGFTSDAVVPARLANSITFLGVLIRTSSLAYSEGYSLKDAVGEFTFIVKVPDSEGYEYYTVETNVDEYKALTVTVPEGMKNSEGYLVGFTWAPYAKCPDGIYSGSKSAEQRCYAHLGIGKSDLYVDFTPVEPAIPDNYSPKGLEYENGVISGLDEKISYEYAQFDINGISDWISVSGKTEIKTDLCGLIAVRFDDERSTPAFLYAPGRNRTNIIHTTPTLNYEGTATIDVVDVVNAGKFADARGRVAFNEGKWTGIALSNSLALRYNYDRFTLGTTGIIPVTIADSLKNATDSAEIEKARADAAKASADIYFSYAYAPDEIIPMSDFIGFDFRVSYRQGGFNVNGSVQTKLVFKVIDKNGKLVDREVYKDAAYTFAGTNHKITLSDFAKTDGYIVGIVIYPYVLTEGSYFEYKNSYYGDYCVYLSEEAYKVDVIMPSDKPILSITEKDAVITIENYNKNVTYAYSDNGGKDWVTFEACSFVPMKASAEYIVKALGNDKYLESDVSEVVMSPALTVTGVSLVLDGTLGIKVYMDIDRATLEDVDFMTKRINKDFEEYAERYVTEESANFTNGCDWLSPITLDDETGLYYTIISLPAKDTDNMSFLCDIGGYIDGERVTISTINGNELSLPLYVENAKTLALAGDIEFIKAQNLINSLETYVDYADNYFSGGDMPEYTISDTISAESPSRTGNLDGATFYGTSLILEDSITLRHYFKLTDRDAFFDKYAPHGEKNGFVFYDIKDIPAQDITKTQKLTISDANGTSAEISYSIANYIKDAKDKEDTRLTSLMNSMYDYGTETNRYAYPKSLYVKYDSGIKKESALGGIHIYIPTAEGYIDHTYVHTVSTKQNADIWRLSVVYLCDDDLNSLYPITVENAEWDMALKMNDRPDFVGGYAHGDEFMTDVKFTLDGNVVDVTTLTSPTEFTKLEILENSIGYDPIDGITPALKHKKNYIITHAGVRLEHRVEWLGDYSLGYSYLAMLPPPKTYTDMYYTNTTAPTAIIQGGSNKVDGATSVTVYGSESGLYYTMTVNYYNTFNEPHMFITDNAGGSYNKTYFAYVKNGSVKNGDVWETFTHYKIEKK